MGFTPATGQEISMGCVYEAFGLAPFPGANIGLNSTLGVNRQPPQAVGVSAIPLNSETELSVDMGGLDTIDEYCDIPTPTNTPTNTTTPTNTPTNTQTPNVTPTPSSTPPPCNVYEYINTTENTTFSFGPFPLCPGPGDFDIQIIPGAEGVTSCIEQLSQGTIDAFNAQGLTLTSGECFTPPIPVTVVECGTTYTSDLFEQAFNELFRVPLGTGTGTSSYTLDVAAAAGAGTTGAIRFVVTYNDVTVQDTGWVSKDPSANSVYLTGLNNLLTALGYPTVASITVISSPITGIISKNLSSVENAFVEVFIYTPSSSTGNPFAFRINCVVPIPTPTPTPTATSITNIPCGTPSSFSGETGYPITQSVTLGNPTGNVLLIFNAYSVPDRFIVQWNNNVVIDTGYRGTSNYNFGGAQRAAFNNSLTGRIDPITLNTYPDFVTYPTDGYPPIVGLGGGSALFNKNSPNPTSVTVKVYGPMPETEWEYELDCPV